MHKRFQLVRKSDAVGISGSCVICEGILWSDGSATVTEIVWLDGDDASSC